MRRIMLKSKIHRATVTGASIDYEGSITIDRELMAAADIFEYEQVQVLDVNNGNRLTTYAIAGDEGQICINGAAARLVDVGDIVIILSYGGLVPNEWAGHEPVVVKVDADNRMTGVSGGGKACESAAKDGPAHCLGGHGRGHGQEQECGGGAHHGCGQKKEIR